MWNQLFPKSQLNLTKIRLNKVKEKQVKQIRLSTTEFAKFNSKIELNDAYVTCNRIIVELN